MDAFKVEFDFIEFEQGLKAAAKDQFPFATARALTRTAKDAQKKLQDILPQKFVLRTPFLKRGIRINPATKTHLQSEVGSVDDLMEDHVTGGVRTAKGTRTIPTKNIRPAFASKVPKSKRPKALLSKGGKRKPFFVTFNSGRKALVQRKGRERLPIKVLYQFPSRVVIKQRLDLEGIVGDVVKDRWQPNMVDSLEKAMRTAR